MTGGTEAAHVAVAGAAPATADRAVELWQRALDDLEERLRRQAAVAAGGRALLDTEWRAPDAALPDALRLRLELLTARSLTLEEELAHHIAESIAMLPVSPYR